MNDLDPRFLATEYVVEATDAEQFFLWQLESGSCKWEQGGSGLMIQVGEIGGWMQQSRPVNISCTWNRINGMNVLFWYGCSQVVDYKMITEWFAKNCFPYEAVSKRAAKCDAMNFHHCLGYSKEERPKIKTDGLITGPFNQYYYRPASKSSIVKSF